MKITTGTKISPDPNKIQRLIPSQWFELCICVMCYKIFNVNTFEIATECIKMFGVSVRTEIHIKQQSIVCETCTECYFQLTKTFIVKLYFIFHISSTTNFYQ